jgi:TP901 family phage tail tape measure protein
MSDAIISIGADTRQMERDIQSSLSSANWKFPLGKIKGQLGEFEKSLEASNARVVAFGASAGSIYLLTDAFKEMVKSTIDVEKTLADINSVVNVSEKDIKSFGNAIFNVANKTSQSFETAAGAALEFSRQGLGLEQTVKRTSAALMLARLSGLSAAASVEALTAAVNSFSDSGLDATQVVNKLAAVDAKYAVSSADLAEAIKRVGSSANEAGVNIDQLVALVTSAQQTTARGGAVIGNSFKTIFTRLQRPKVLEDLQEIGIRTTDAAGETLPLIQILTQLARTFDTLGSAQKSQVGELVGGVYQINILKAVLGDLSKGYSTYSGALKASSGATNEAEARTAKLGETLDSQITRITNNLKRAGSVVGQMTIAPALEKVLSNVNNVLETFVLGKEPETLGEKAASGFLKGLGGFISGPGLMLAAVGAFQIFKRLATFVGDAGKTVLGLGQAAQQQAQIQAQILQVLQKNPQVYAQIESGAISVQSAAQAYLNIVNATNVALEKQKAIAAQMAGTMMGGGISAIPVSSGGASTAPISRGKRGRGRAAGYIPSIADQKKMEEADARNLGAPSGVRAHFGKGTIGGKKFLMNNHEIEIPNYGNNGDSAVIPKYSRGFISRFAAGDGSISLDQYMMSKYKMIRPLESLGGPALNGAYDKGVSLEEIRSRMSGVSSKWSSWTRGGASGARDQTRGDKRAESQKEHYRTYQYRKIKLPWDKTLADFGNDPNAFGDAYEDFIANKFGAKRGERFSRANDLGASGFDPISKYNTTDIDFVVPKNAGDLSKGGTLIEARGGSSKNYNPSDIKKKFDKFFIRNPFLRGQKLDPKNWKRVLIAANAAGYIPRFAKGSKQKRRARYYRDNPRPSPSLSLVPSGKEYTGELANLPAKPALKFAPRFTQEDLLQQRIADAESKSLANKKAMARRASVTVKPDALAPRQTGYKSTFFSAPESSAGDPAVLKALNRRERKLAKRRGSSIAPISVSATAAGATTGGAGGSGGGGKGSAKGGGALGGGGLGGGSVSKGGGMFGGEKGGATGAIIKSLMAHQLLSGAQSFGMIGEEGANLGSQALAAYDQFSMIKSLQEEYFPKGGKGGKITGGIGKVLNSKIGGKASGLGRGLAGKLGKTSIGKGIANLGSKASGLLARSGIGSLAGGLARFAGPLGLAYTAGQAGSAAIDYFGGGEMLGGASFGQKQINKEQEQAAKEMEKFKTKEGQSLSSYSSALSSKYGFGNENIAELRSGAVSGAVEGLGGVKNIKSIVDKFGGVGAKGELSKGKLDNITEEVFNSLKRQGKETGGLDFNAENFKDLQNRDNQAQAGLPGVKALNEEEKKLLETYKTAKDVAAGLVKEVAGFERTVAAQKAFDTLSKQLTTMQASATQMLNVYKQITAAEKQRSEMLAKNLGGGVGAYLDPTKAVDSMSKIYDAMKILNNPRLAGNAVERGRAAHDYLQGTAEMGIELNKNDRSRLSRMQDYGMQRFQTQNFSFLNSVTGGFRNNLGLSQGINQGIYNAGQIASASGRTIQESQFMQNPESVASGYLGNLQSQALNMTSTQVAAMTEASKKLQESVEKFGKLAEAYAGGKISEADFTRIQSSVEGAIKSASDGSDPNGNSQAEVVKAINRSFASLDTVAQSIIESKNNPVDVKVNTKIELTPEALKYLRIGETFQQMMSDNKGTPPSSKK